MDAVTNPVGKKMRVTMNNSIVADVICSSAYYGYQKVESLVNLSVGVVDISMKMYGTTPDMGGIIIAGVYLRRLVSIFSTVNSTTNFTNSTSNTTNTINTTSNVTSNTTPNVTTNTTSNTTTNTSIAIN